jgi:hypothetical protein
MPQSRIYLNPRKPWSSDEESRLKELVQSGKYSYPELAAFFPGRSSDSLRCHARQYLDVYSPYKQHKYVYSTDFFETPNPINSYIAGFLAADGSIRLSDKQAPVLVLSLSAKDLSHLEIIKSKLQYTGPIYDHTNHRTKGGHGMMTLQISVSEEYTKHLADNFGVTPRKTYRLEPPALDYINSLCYLIGLIDGDGCVHITPDRIEASISFVSSSEVAVKWIKNTIDQIDIPSPRAGRTVNITPKYGGNAFTIRYQGLKAIGLIKIAQKLKHQFHIPLLDRKWDNDRVNQRIIEFNQQYPDFIYKSSFSI